MSSRLNVRYGQTWTFNPRPTRDKFGDTTQGTPYTVDGCVFWSNAETQEDFGRGTISIDGNLAVPKGSPIDINDQAVSPTGEPYNIIGIPLWDQVHPMSGWDPGFTLYKVKGVFA